MNPINLGADFLTITSLRVLELARELSDSSPQRKECQWKREPCKIWSPKRITYVDTRVVPDSCIVPELQNNWKHIRSNRMSSPKPEPSKTATNDFFTFERMLISWVRTSLSLISFGFTIYKFFQYLVQSKAAEAEAQRGPRNLGMSLVAVGTLVLLAATFQY